MASFPLYATCPTMADTGDFDIVRALNNGVHNGFIFCIKNFTSHHGNQDISFWNNNVLCEGVKWAFRASNINLSRRDGFIRIQIRAISPHNFFSRTCDFSYGVLPCTDNDKRSKPYILRHQKDIWLFRHAETMAMELRIPPGLTIENLLTDDGTLRVVVFAQITAHGLPP